jgi:oxygen-dependent protoporphyrinogen oxidase
MVLGGGITGLAAMYFLARARAEGAPVEARLLEASDRLGGVIRTERADGFVMEAGPDSFISEKPEAAALCREIGLGDDLIGSNDHQRLTCIFHRGRMVPLPDGLMLLVPTRLWPMATTPLLSLRSKLTIAAEWFASPPARTSGDADETVASFVRRHFGADMLENIADPLLAGVFGGDSNSLSIRAVLPRFWEMEQKQGSLTRATLALRRQRGATGRSDAAGTTSAPPLFLTLKDGLDQLVSRLAAQIDRARLHVGRCVKAVLPNHTGPTPRYTVRAVDGGAFEADAVICALPAAAAARVLGAVSTRVADLLGAIPASSSLTVSLGYGPGTQALLPPGFGFLVPRKANRRLLAATFVHAKFSHRAPESHALIRCFLGGIRDPDVLRLSDDEVLSLARSELAELLRFRAEPQVAKIARWPGSMPQYTVGHLERMMALETELSRAPGIFVAGNAYSGIGISDCIRTARIAVDRVVGMARG